MSRAIEVGVVDLSDARFFLGSGNGEPGVADLLGQVGEFVLR